MGITITNSAEHVFPGAIILLHELKQTVAALPTFIEILLKKNFSFTTS
ncbi:MAG: hypothetical protein KGZ96_07975 [Clostridia bacterium]|jgi:peptidoglycan/xylan/chitin deacetylase (PgdA/CDA1 family)|nr:hypothetical protein [Clostridia bacterium]